MKVLFTKTKKILKEDGLIKTIKQIWRYLSWKVYVVIRPLGKLKYKFKRNQLQQLIKKTLSGKYDRIVLWRSNFGWDVTLFQRPQHIANNMAKQKTLVLYEVSYYSDKVEYIEKLKNNLFLVNWSNEDFANLLLSEIDKIQKPKYLQYYSTELDITVDYAKQFIEKGYKILYEYIDDLHPAISTTEVLPKNIEEKYDFAMNDKENTFVVVTADKLYEDVVSKRGKGKLAYSCNGVDYNHFQISTKDFEYNQHFQKVLKENKKIIGYYGALAQWFDYELVIELAKKRPDYNIVLIGALYDDSYNKKMDEYKNVHYIGKIPYEILPNYAKKFDVCCIPFLINDITQATSPLKLFEYMALKKPIVTTAMHECKKYKSVLIGETKSDFVKKVDKAMSLVNDQKYQELLEKEAKENTWESKTKIILDLLGKHEKK